LKPLAEKQWVLCGFSWFSKPHFLGPKDTSFANGCRDGHPTLSLLWMQWLHEAVPQPWQPEGVLERRTWQTWCSLWCPSSC
jgi:hypothetical protein